MGEFENRIENFDQVYRNYKETGTYFYLQEVEKLNGARVQISGKEYVMFSSYSYLGLLQHPEIDAFAKEAVDRFGTGTHGVRVLAGTTSLHVELEKKIADFMKVEDSIAYSSGFIANVASIASLLGRHDIVITDKLCHASIVDGCLLAQAKFQRFKHNDLKDLENQLIRAEKDGCKGKLVIVDAVYSMDGDVCPLPETLEICNKYDAWLMVDEAHSLGVLGETGRGLAEYFGMDPREIHLYSGSLSKTIPAVGGYVAGDKKTINYFRHNARGFVFSAALPPAAVAAAIKSFEIIDTERWRLKQVRENIDYFIKNLNQMGFDTLNTQSCVIPIIIGQEEPTLQLTGLLHRDGMFVSPILPPAVPVNTCRLRANVIASHTKEDLDFALNLLEKHGKALGIIGGENSASYSV